MSYILIYLAVGSVAGILAGLLGIGGGLVIVPLLTTIFTSQGIHHDVIVHLALGTSLASIVFTSISSVWSHYKRSSVGWDVVARITPGIVAGTYLGTWVAAMLSTNILKGFFGLFILYVATQMLMGLKPKAGRTVPGTAGIFGAGCGIGVFSSLAGIGGGTLGVPFLTWCNLRIHKAIGTAAGIGLPIAVTGTLGYIINGWNAPNLPVHSLGYVSLPVLSGIVFASVLTAPVGVRLAHSLPVEKLKKIFAILLYAVSTKMLLSIVI
jgi:uncharacterized membrane protein YfcA